MTNKICGVDYNHERYDLLAIKARGKNGEFPIGLRPGGIFPGTVGENGLGLVYTLDGQEVLLSTLWSQKPAVIQIGSRT